MSSTVRGARLGVGILSTLLSLLTLGLIQRQFSLWTAFREGYYLVSTGFYVIILVILLIGVSWGVKSGEAAEKIWAATAGSICLIVALPTVYYTYTGMVLGDGVNTIFAALVGMATLISVVLILCGVLTVSDRRRESIYKALEKLVDAGILTKTYEREGEGLVYKLSYERVVIDLHKMDIQTD